ncbi:major capsid protein [Kitasatospora sp. NPDC058046]|uniref:major capsid protein n=1 Tax=Kitasatospora sp. NPDC058046 TaxID=3346312 RepID=UPI0036DB9FD0
MDPFELPENFSALTDDELGALLDNATGAFEARSGAANISTEDLAEMRALAAGVASIRAEQAARLDAAQQAAAEIDALAAQVRGETPEEPAVAEPEAEAEPEIGATASDGPEPEATAAATPPARPAPTLNLGAVRARQRRVLPEPEKPATRITASVDVPGHKPGSEIDFDALTSGTIARANALKTVGGGSSQVASYVHPFPEELIVTDAGSLPEGTSVTLAASGQRRLPQGDLVASGGWCSPSETVYEIADVACPDMLWDVPETQLARGGLRFYKTPTLDVSALTWVHTEADDIAGTTKPCFKVPCPQPEEVRCDAVGVCLEAGILTQRHFPELVSWYLRNQMVAHEIRIKQELFSRALASATAVTLAATMGTVSAVYAAVALQAADMIERHSLCESTALEVVFPWWSRSMMLADLARRNGAGLDEVNLAMIQETYTPLGVRVQWARGLAPAVPTDIGGATPATTWPDEVRFLMYPAGSLQLGRGAEINLGVVHDSAKFSTNDYTATFSEECVALVNRSVDTRLVTVPVCADGTTGAQKVLTCPVA